MDKVKLIKITKKTLIVEGDFGNGIERKTYRKENFSLTDDLIVGKVYYIIDDFGIKLLLEPRKKS